MNSILVHKLLILISPLNGLHKFNLKLLLYSKNDFNIKRFYPSLGFVVSSFQGEFAVFMDH